MLRIGAGTSGYRADIQATRAGERPVIDHGIQRPLITIALCEANRWIQSAAFAARNSMQTFEKILRQTMILMRRLGGKSIASRPRWFAGTCLPWHAEETGKKLNEDLQPRATTNALGNRECRSRHGCLQSVTSPFCPAIGHRSNSGPGPNPAIRQYPGLPIAARCG